jgi:hypothetical protein
MYREVPDGLSPMILRAVLPIRDELVAAGWTFGAIGRDGSGVDRKLAFSAKSPTGKSIYIACHEDALASKLRALLV